MLDWEAIFIFLCQPKPYVSCIPPSEFATLTLPQIVTLLAEGGKQKEKLNTKLHGYKAAMEATYKYRRENVPVDQCPPNKSKEEFYGIWPFSESTG